ncbi:Spindle assembly checkpoint kinase [Lachnellula arida]|uniref:Spindle assembly checkpoint kinase n=1 Tax=Lachnellula arida TaxID=1316785 RepID=A0A8T9AXV7_9HELO|nr:Spindle assembly checkpoint kinase [Lachnellula arida]
MSTPSNSTDPSSSLVSKPHFIFAKLVPANIEAQRLFSELAEAVLSNPTNPDYIHYAKFLHIEPYSPNSPDHQTRQESQESQTASETDDGTSVKSSPNYQGHYILSFEVDPLIPDIGWVIGFGRWSKKQSANSGPVDLLLAPPGTSSVKFEVAGKHARLFFDKDAVLTLKVFSHRGYTTALGNEGFKEGQRSITTRKSRVSFGSLSYSLEFSDLNEEEYNNALRKYLNNHLKREAPSSDISATPSPMDTLVGEWNIRGTVGNGSFGVVNVTKNIRTGETGAAKCLVRNSMETHAKILREIDTLKALPRKLRLLQYFAEYYERGDRWYTGILNDEDERYSLRTRPEKVIIIYGPFVRFNLSEELFLKQPLNIRMAAFYQVLQGLEGLHGEGFIHRDIKPSNIGVVNQSADTIEVVILDYGETVRAERYEPCPGKAGTIPFLAPEMEQRPYGKEVDLWATGIVGIQLFVSGGKLPWRNVVSAEAAWKKQVDVLQSAPANSVRNLLVSMIAWDPAQRTPAEVALKHPCFNNVRIACDMKTQEASKLGSKRKHT